MLFGGEEGVVIDLLFHLFRYKLAAPVKIIEYNIKLIKKKEIKKEKKRKTKISTYQVFRIGFAIFGSKRKRYACGKNLAFPWP